MKILITAPALSKVGGVSNYIRTILPRFREDVECFAVGARNDGESTIVTAFRLITDSFAFARTVRRQVPDVVHLNPSFGFKALARDALLLGIAKLYQRKVLVFLHGWDERCERQVLRRFPWLFRLLFRRADCIVVLASEFERKLRGLGYDKPVFQLAAPVNPKFFEAVQTHGTPSSRILFLARIERAKGIYEALDTYQILKLSFPSATLTVAGDGPERQPAVAYAGEHGIADIHFTGHLEEDAKIQAFRAADLYLFPSHTEGLPISLLEAMAAGVPVVTSVVGGVPDFFMDSVMGYMSPDLRPETLVRLATALLNDPGLRSRIRIFNSQYARDHFSPEIIAAQLESIYRMQLDAAN